jgi:hypothetical protein
MTTERFLKVSVDKGFSVVLLCSHNKETPQQNRIGSGMVESIGTELKDRQ